MSENLAAWLLYVLSVLGCCIVWWRIFYALNFKQVAWLSTVIVACIFLAPSRVAPETEYWAPAFMGALLELVANTSEGQQPHLLSMSIGFLVGCLIVLIGLRYQAKHRVIAKELGSTPAEEK